MASGKSTIYVFAVILTVLALYVAADSNTDNNHTTLHAISVNASVDDTASIPDFDGDGTIGFGDFVIFAGVFGARHGDEKYDASYDLNDDGEIGFSDFVIFARNFGRDAPSLVVSIPDSNLRAAIEDALSKDSGAPITRAEMKTLVRISAQAAGIRDLTGLESATSLKELDLQNNDITDVSAVARLTNLVTLLLNGNIVTDITGLSDLSNLNLLRLGQNDIADVSALTGLTNLTILSLDSNNITDISTLAGLTSLRRLLLRHNNIMDISALDGLTRLVELELRGNPLSDSSIEVHIPVHERQGTAVSFDSFRLGDFDIELVFLDTFTERRKRVLQWAAKRWMAVIAEDLQAVEFTRGWSGKCGDQLIEIPSGDRIDDLRIYVTSHEPEGNPLGWGGPRMLREEGQLPVIGCMAFTRGRLNLPVTGLHEMGHVLGFGTIWHRFGFFQNPPDGDQHFNGPLAIAAFDDAGGRDYAGAKVPVIGGHWRRTVLAGELMADGGGGSLSAVTVQSLADLGYGVDVSQADPYTLPGAGVGAKIAVPAPASPAFGGNHAQMDVRIRSGAYFLPRLRCWHSRATTPG